MVSELTNADNETYEKLVKLTCKRNLTVREQLMVAYIRYCSLNYLDYKSRIKKKTKLALSPYARKTLWVSAYIGGYRVSNGYRNILLENLTVNGYSSVRKEHLVARVKKGKSIDGEFTLVDSSSITEPHTWVSSNEIQNVSHDGLPLYLGERVDFLCVVRRYRSSESMSKWGVRDITLLNKEFTKDYRMKGYIGYLATDGLERFGRYNRSLERKMATYENVSLEDMEDTIKRMVLERGLELGLW